MSVNDEKTTQQSIISSSATTTRKKNHYDWVVVDGSSYLFRAYHAMPDFTNSKGDATGAVYGIVNMLKKLFARFKSEQLVVVFDAPGKTFRSDIYPEYKANRPPMPDDLRQQIQWVHDIIAANGWPIICISGVEADDVIGTLAVKAGNVGETMLISSGDKDLAQLVNDNISVIDSMRNVIYDEAQVIEKFGVKPNQIIDYLALVGDTSDNIPGIPGVGPKTAVKWLLEHENVDNVMAHADAVKGKIGEKLRDNIANIPLSYNLATIKCDVELDVDLKTLVAAPADKETLKTMYATLEFNSWLQLLNKPDSTDATSGNAESTTDQNADHSAGHSLGNSASTNIATGAPAIPTPLAAYERKPFDIINTQALWQQWQERILAADVVAIDTETTSLNAYQAELVGISFAVEGRAAYLPLAHRQKPVDEQEDLLGAVDIEVSEKDQAETEAEAGIAEQLALEAIRESLQSLLSSSKQRKVFHNLKYDLAIFNNHGFSVGAPFDDTMIMSYVINSTATKHDLDSLVKTFLGHDMISYTDVAGKGKAQIPFAEVPIEVAADYASEDAELTYALYQLLKAGLENTQQSAEGKGSLADVYHKIDLPLVPVLESVERIGIKLDVNYLHDLTKIFEVELAEVEAKIYEEAGEEFNVASPKQIQEILFDKMAIPVLRKTPKGQPSTSEDVLQELAEDHALPAMILTHRGLSKLMSTYTKALPLAADDALRVHSSFHQAVAITGRLSSSNPNLQNIPIRSEAGRKIRQAFVAEKGCKLIAADYSQVELRIMAHLSQDASLLDAFAKDEDVHARTAAELFNVAVADVAFEQRRFSKAINFGLIYGMSAFGLAKQLGIGREEAQGYIDLYFERYPGVKRFMDTIRIKAAEQGYVETVFGRRLYLPEINAKNFNRRQYAERTAINAPMQGTAADIIKKAMIRLHDDINAGRLAAKMILQVHDELIFEVNEADVETVTAYVQHVMTEVAELSVPLRVDIGVGDNWEQAH